MNERAREIAEKWCDEDYGWTKESIDELAADIEAALRDERRKAMEEACKVACVGCWSGDAEYIEWHRQKCGCKYRDIRDLIDADLKSEGVQHA